MSRGFFHAWFQRTAEAAGLPVARQHPHALRHGLGSTKAAAGETPLQIAAALRHRSARMALQFYGQVSDDAVTKASRVTFSKYPWLYLIGLDPPGWLGGSFCCPLDPSQLT